MKRKRLNPKSYPKAIQDLVSIDYVDQLTQAQKEWLAAFNEYEYGSNPDCLEELTGKAPTEDQKRESYRKQKKIQADALSNDKPRVDFEEYVAASESRVNDPEATENSIIDQLDHHRKRHPVSK